MYKEVAISTGKALLQAGIALVISNIAQQHLRDSGKQAFEKITQSINLIHNANANRRAAKLAQ